MRDCLPAPATQRTNAREKSPLSPSPATCRRPLASATCHQSSAVASSVLNCCRCCTTERSRSLYLDPSLFLRHRSSFDGSIAIYCAYPFNLFITYRLQPYVRPSQDGCHISIRNTSHSSSDLLRLVTRSGKLAFKWTT